VLEKYHWVEKYFERDFTKRLVLTKDKTIIHGDFLIDDKPKPEKMGLSLPSGNI